MSASLHLFLELLISKYVSADHGIGASVHGENPIGRHRCA